MSKVRCWCGEVGEEDDICPEGKCQNHPRISWAVVGGESGPGARPMHQLDGRTWDEYPRASA